MRSDVYVQMCVRKTEAKSNLWQFASCAILVWLCDKNMKKGGVTVFGHNCHKMPRTKGDIFLCLLAALFSASCEYGCSNLLPRQPWLGRSFLLKEHSQGDRFTARCSGRQERGRLLHGVRALKQLHGTNEFLHLRTFPCSSQTVCKPQRGNTSKGGQIA